MVQSRDVRLRKKREAERRRYERLKSDKEGQDYLKNKEKKQYALKKKKKVIVPVKDLSEREQRAKRKEWKLKKRQYRISKQTLDKERQFLLEQTPPESEGETDDNLINQVIKLNKQKAASSRKRKSRALKEKDCVIEKLQRKVEKYKKRYQREKRKRKHKNGDLPTPRTRVNILLSDDKKKNEVKRKLLFAESITDQLNENYHKLESQKEKRYLRKVMSGNIIKKNRLLSMYNRKLRVYKGNSELNRKSCNRRPRKDKIFGIELKKLVVNFYLEDSSSRFMPGKKDCITKGKKKMQKRILNSSIKHLHREFLRTHPGQHVSYAHFCKLKPFWVKKMNASSRDTCQCIKCANVELLCQALCRMDVLSSPTLENVKKQFCCNPRSERCLFRQCSKCPPLTVRNEVPSNMTQTKYYKWSKVTETFFNKKSKKESTCKKVTKVLIVCSPKQVVEAFEAVLPVYFNHEGTKIHQYRAIRDLKKSLKSNEAVIQMDFSENYETKFSQEIQSYHFGGSRQQITLHTVVVHVKEDSEVKNINFCTLSESLKHDVPAIWAHLTPVLNYIKENHTIDVLHFVSDGPSTQYRNKTMFYYLATHLIKKYERVKSFSWNYLEAGHGKGAPDGIGGVSKRTADAVVGEGKDVSNFQQLITCLQERVPKVKYIPVSEQDIEIEGKKIKEEDVRKFKGTMQVHQVVNNELELNVLNFRTISHFGANKNTKIGTLTYKPKNQHLSNGQCLAGPSCMSITRLKYADVYSDVDEDEIQNPKFPINSFSAMDIKDQTYVIVEFQEKSRKKQNQPITRYRYAAVCRGQVDEEGEVGVMFLRVMGSKQTGQLFRMDEKDFSSVSFEQIKYILQPPVPIFKGKRMFFKFSTELDIFKKP